MHACAEVEKQRSEQRDLSEEQGARACGAGGMGGQWAGVAGIGVGDGGAGKRARAESKGDM